MNMDDFCTLLLNYHHMTCTSHSDCSEEALGEIARDLKRGWMECFQCDGAGKEDSGGHWEYKGKSKKCVWVKQEPESDICSKCKGKKRISYRLADVQAMLKRD